MRFFPHYVIVGFSNSYLIADDEGDEAVLVDPGIFDNKILTLIESNRLSIRAVLVTHDHESHINGIRTLLKIYDATIYAFRDTIMDLPTTPVRDQQIIRCGKLEFKVFETPGHSRDSLVFQTGNFLFTGDTLTAGLTGTAAHAQAHSLLLSSIRKKIIPLGDEVVVFPGHGPPTRVGIERRYNVMLNAQCPRSRSSSAFL
jgi:glyoxylase-like metal-dependent hydrolase (beta-lactamase superfamily II)